MAEYTLRLQLEGAESIEKALGGLRGLVAGVAGGKTPAAAVSSDLNKATSSAGALNQQLKGVADTLNKIRKGDDLSGGISGITPKMLSMMSDADRAKVMAKQQEILSKSSGGKLKNPLPFQGPDMGGILQAKWLKTAMQGPDLTGALRAKYFSNLKTQGPDLTGALRAEDASRMEREGEKQQIAASRLNIAMSKKAAANAARALKDDQTFKKDMSFLMMPIFNPGSMWATMFSGRQTFSALNTATGASFLKNHMGGMGAGAATGVLVGSATAVGLALKALSTVVSETTKAFENARQLYAKSLTNGMGLGFTAKRSMLANIMGVSETEVFRFGAQMSYLNPKLQQASEILARTAIPLTQVSWEFGVLWADLKALFSTIANECSPAILGLAQNLEGLTKAATGLVPSTKPGSGGAFFKALFGGAAALGQGNPLGAILGWMGGIGMFGKDDPSKKMPGTASWMKQLPASSWEKMGLVVGGGQNNYAKQTANNTRQMARDLSAVAKFITRNGGTVSNAPGSQFALSMIQNAP